jgi:hypothetical protein
MTITENLDLATALAIAEAGIAELDRAVCVYCGGENGDWDSWNCEFIHSRCTVKRANDEDLEWREYLDYIAEEETPFGEWMFGEEV